MFPNDVFNGLFTSGSCITVLRALYSRDSGITGRETARLAGVNHRTALLTLKALEKTGVVNRLVGGRDHIFTLNKNHYLVENGLSGLFLVEENYAEGIHNQIVKRIGESSIAVIAYAPENPDESPMTMNICVVYKSRRDALDVEFPGLVAKVEKRYGVKIKPYFIHEYTFVDMEKRKMQPVADIVKHGEVICGKIPRG
jgi:predicted regulator of amino acid metabolism with ACT domain